jgi:methyltransferase|nr:MAG TPA: malonyl-acyl carrier protein O-methyltransferase BioC [Caudoviricetes sp.]
MSKIKILDACCGSRMFWFDKNESHTTFMDIRQETFEIHDKKVNVNLDVIGDFRDMPFEDNTFNLVVFDPPHLKWAGKNSIMKAQYGQLDKVTWSEDLAKGFEECMRVLKIGGTLVFKWSDCQINVKKLLEVIPFKPLFGQQRGTTHWLTFVKFEEDQHGVGGLGGLGT